MKENNLKSETVFVHINSINEIKKRTELYEYEFKNDDLVNVKLCIRNKFLNEMNLKKL